MAITSIFGISAAPSLFGILRLLLASSAWQAPLSLGMLIQKLYSEEPALSWFSGRRRRLDAWVHEP